ncbi:hypothetical protein ACOMHN_008020 [Nucella lapillus]
MSLLLYRFVQDRAEHNTLGAVPSLPELSTADARVSGELALQEQHVHVCSRAASQGKSASVSHPAPNLPLIYPPSFAEAWLTVRA